MNRRFRWRASTPTPPSPPPLFSLLHRQTDSVPSFLQCLVYLARQCSGARLEVREQYRSAAVHQAISGRFSRATAAAVVEEERIRMRRG